MLADQPDRLLRITVYAQGNLGQTGIPEGLHALDFVFDIFDSRC